jgi:hypothetical protein
MWIKRKSILTGVERTRNIPVNPDDMAIWQAGLGNVQDLMPYLNDSDREFILSGIKDGEWDKVFTEQLEEEMALLDDEAAF